MLGASPQGEKGEARFREICADADLVCNKSERDRTGWDFIVEFPFDLASTGRGAIETRKTPPSCHIQVKTLLEKSDRFSMRLSSAERLAKELKPAFIYVFKMNDALEFSSAYLIHILDAPLGTILKRLRKEDAVGNRAPNTTEISMSVSKYGLAIAPTGKALRDTLQSMCGTDLLAYAGKKAEQLTKLGFESHSLELQMTLHFANSDEIVDAFLGLKKEIPASDVRSTQTRFGIKLPLPENLEGKSKITIQPSPADTCKIAVRSDQLSPPAIFRGKVFFPGIPNLPPERKKVLIESDFFSLIVRKDGWTINSRSPGSQAPAVWAAYWKLALAMAMGKGTIQIISDSMPIDVTMNITAGTKDLDVDQCRYLIDICEKVSALFKQAGVTEEPILPIEEIHENAVRILSAYKLAHPESGPVPFSFATENSAALTEAIDTDLTYVDFLTLGNVTLGYYGLAHVTGSPIVERVEWRSQNLALKGISVLRSFPSKYEDFIEAAKKSTGCNNVYSRPAADETPSGT